MPTCRREAAAGVDAARQSMKNQAPPTASGRGGVSFAKTRRPAALIQVVHRAAHPARARRPGASSCVVGSAHPTSSVRPLLAPRHAQQQDLAQHGCPSLRAAWGCIIQYIQPKREHNKEGEAPKKEPRPKARLRTLGGTDTQGRDALTQLTRTDATEPKSPCRPCRRREAWPAPSSSASRPPSPRW